MTLSDALKSRDNNLTPVRLFLSWLVLFGHSYAIVNRPGMVDPFSAALRAQALPEQVSALALATP